MGFVGGPQELKTLLVDYAKQETIDPLKTLGRYLAFGVCGALCFALAMTFWALAVLRFVQTFAYFDESWRQMIPYCASIVTIVFFGFITLRQLSQAKKEVE